MFVKKLTPSAQLPTRGSPLAAGADLYALKGGLCKPGERVAIGTGIGVRARPGTYLRVAPRSGLAYWAGIDVMAGVIDEDYTGELMIILVNHGEDDFKWESGERVAQLIEEVIRKSEIVEVDELPPTSRADGGFGSTGI